MAMTVDGDGQPLLVIAQPGATYVTLDHKLRLHTETAPTTPDVGSFRGGVSTELVRLPLANDERGSCDIAIAAVDGTSACRPGAAFLQSAALNAARRERALRWRRAGPGTVKLFDRDLRQVWELPVGQPLFALAHADMNNDGHEEMAACSWDGLALIMDRQRNVVQFQFTDAVCAFCAGTRTIAQVVEADGKQACVLSQGSIVPPSLTPTLGVFACEPGKNSPCIIFVDYEDRITLYYDLQLSTAPAAPLTDAILEGLEVWFPCEHIERGCEDSPRFSKFGVPYARSFPTGSKSTARRPCCVHRPVR